MTNFIGIDLLGFETKEIAMLVSISTLFVLVLPSMVRRLLFKEHVRFSIIERHRINLRAASVRRGRAQQSGRQNGRQSRALHWLLGYVGFILPRQYLKDKKRLFRSAGFLQERIFLIFMSMRGVCAILIIIIILLIFFRSDESANSKTLVVLFCLSLLVFFASDWLVRWQRKKRLQRLERGLPECLDLLVICAEAGLSLDAGLKRVAEEFLESCADLSEELLLTSVELNFLPDRRQALINLGSRVDIPAFRGVTTALIQTEKYGTPLTQALRTLASEFRETRLLKAEEKAARLPAILTVPLICFILPALFIVLAGPAFISVFANFG